MMSRYFIYLSFDGTAYHGWQIQPNGISVQQVLQERLSTLLRGTIEVVVPVAPTLVSMPI